jgi:CheY-like chemotaxis protein
MPSEMTDIIVVDDNQVLLSVIAEIFKECGYMLQLKTEG